MTCCMTLLALLVCNPTHILAFRLQPEQALSIAEPEEYTPCLDKFQYANLESSHVASLSCTMIAQARWEFANLYPTAGGCLTSAPHPKLASSPLQSGISSCVKHPDTAERKRTLDFVYDQHSQMLYLGQDLEHKDGAYYGPSTRDDVAPFQRLFARVCLIDGKHVPVFGWKECSLQEYQRHLRCSTTGTCQHTEKVSVADPQSLATPGLEQDQTGDSTTAESPYRQWEIVPVPQLDTPYIEGSAQGNAHPKSAKHNKVHQEYQFRNVALRTCLTYVRRGVFGDVELQPCVNDWYENLDISYNDMAGGHQKRRGNAFRLHIRPDKKCAVRCTPGHALNAQWVDSRGITNVPASELMQCDANTKVHYLQKQLCLPE
jgi:hypothetical protein